MFTKDEFDMFSLRCEPTKLILRFGEPQPLELDIFAFCEIFSAKPRIDMRKSLALLTYLACGE